MNTLSPELQRANYRDNRRFRALTQRCGRAKKGTIVARVHVGLEEAEWHWICDLAHGTECTVSEVIREIIREGYERCLEDLSA